MSYNKDLVLRTIRQIAEMIARMLGLKAEGNKEEFLKTANQISVTISGKTPDEILEMELEEIIRTLEIKKIEELYKAEFLADVLVPYSDFINDNNKKFKALLLAEELLDYVSNIRLFDKELATKISKVQNLLKSLENE